jgi:hypothetical protein
MNLISKLTMQFSISLRRKSILSPGILAGLQINTRARTVDIFTESTCAVEGSVCVQSAPQKYTKNPQNSLPEMKPFHEQCAPSKTFYFNTKYRAICPIPRIVEIGKEKCYFVHCKESISYKCKAL